MANLEARVRVDRSTGQIEVSGSEAFVKAILPSLQEMIAGKEVDRSRRGEAAAQAGSRGGNGKHAKAKKSPAAPRNSSKAKTGGGVSVTPIAADLAAKGTTPSLSEFLNRKGVDRENHQELATAIIYYLIKRKGMDAVKTGHIAFCYSELGIKKSTDLPGVLNNVRQRKHWIKVGAERGSSTMTVTGDNFVEHELGAKVTAKK